jgi:galactokinase
VVVVGTGGSHADLTEDYSSIKFEMMRVAKLFNVDFLRDVKESVVMSNVDKIRKKTGDRAVLRTMHFFAENKRVYEQVKLLESRNIKEFLRLVKESGMSSWTLLQNAYSTKSVTEQGIPIALTMTEKALAGTQSAWRVHGGGFAGTILVFIENKHLDFYVNEMEKIFGSGSCYPLRIRDQGVYKF